MKILIVIVLYKQAIKESVAYNSLSQALDEMSFEYGFYVHDNSPVKSNITDENIFYDFHPENSGLSFAFNRAAEYAREQNFDWMLLSDQDTYYPSNILKEYEEVIKDNPNIKLIVPKVKTIKRKLLSPCKYIHKRGRSLRDITSGKHLIKNLSVINSGMMINTDTFIGSGGYNEKIPVDLSDHQFIERYRKIEPFFWVLNGEIIQDFSNENIKPDIMYDRFIRYIDTVRNCDRNNCIESVDYFILLLRRALALTIRTRKIRFLKIFCLNYLCKK